MPFNITGTCQGGHSSGVVLRLRLSVCKAEDSAARRHSLRRQRLEISWRLVFGVDMQQLVSTVQLAPSRHVRNASGNGVSCYSAVLHVAAMMQRRAAAWASQSAATL